MLHLPPTRLTLEGTNLETTSNPDGSYRLSGVPAGTVPVTIDGFSLATAVSNNTTRAAAVDMVSINSLSRIEVSYSPTPESQGTALAGSVNMVLRSSFERARPVFSGNVYVMMRDYRRGFHPTPSPREERTRKVCPGFDFSWVVPVNKRFGFTLSGGRTTQYAGKDWTQNTWRGTGTATNGAAFPHTTPDQPYLSTYALRDGGKETTRNSVGATIDYRLAANDRLSFSLQASTFEERFNQRNLTFNVNRVLPGSFSTTFTRGAAAAGSLQQTNSGNDRLNRTYMPALTWRHDGPVWKADAGLGLSRARYTGYDIDRGFFNSLTTQRSGVTVGFEDIFYLRPRVITVADGTTGAALDPYRLSTYVLTAATRNYQRDAAGRVVLGANGRPVPIVANTSSLEYSRLIFLDRGAHTEKEYLRLFPNLNAIWNVRENLIARAAAYSSVGRPDFNQYAGGITLPDAESAPSSSNRMVVNHARINWNYRGRQRRGVVAAGASIGPGTYNWGSKRLYIDVSGEYHLTKRLSFFANLRNIGDATEDLEIAGPSTPPHAQFRQRLDFGSLWTFGIKGTFWRGCASDQGTESRT